MSIIQFYHQGVEYTTRHELALKYPHLTYNRMQRLLERKDLQRVEYKNQYYFEKASTEQLIEALVPAAVISETIEVPGTWASESVEFSDEVLLALEAGTTSTDDDFWS
jgi:hypothetical protein